MTIPTRWPIGRDALLLRHTAPPPRGGDRPSGDVGISQRGERGLGFACHLVAAVALGGTKRHIGAFNQGLGWLPLSIGRDPDRDRNPTKMFSGRTLSEFVGHDCPADMLGDD